MTNLRLKTNLYAIAALKDRRATLAGEIESYKQGIHDREEMLSHLDATLRALDPSYRADTIPPKHIRQVKLFGGGELIRVGGASEVEVRERKDRVDDAMHATRAAVEEGIPPGGGVALLRASEGLKKVRTQNDDQKTGVEIVRKALSWPARQISAAADEVLHQRGERLKRRHDRAVDGPLPDYASARARDAP